jgi:hypothetical protein
MRPWFPYILPAAPSADCTGGRVRVKLGAARHTATAEQTDWAL